MLTFKQLKKELKLYICPLDKYSATSLMFDLCEYITLFKSFDVLREWEFKMGIGHTPDSWAEENEYIKSIFDEVSRHNLLKLGKILNRYINNLDRKENEYRKKRKGLLNIKLKHTSYSNKDSSLF